MIAEIGGALSGLKGAMDIAKGLNAVADTVALNDAKIGLQSAILEAQSSLLAAQEAQTANLRRIEQLEQEIVRLKDWSSEKERFELKDTGQGALAYRAKKGMEQGEPSHWLCPNCYEQGRKSIMQPEHLAIGRTETLVCHPCGLDILVSGHRHKEQPTRGGAFGRGR